MHLTKKEEIYYLYWIKREQQHNLYKNGYIGVTFNPEIRFNQHINLAKNGKDLHLYRAIRKYKDIEYKVICIGDFNYICDLEKKLRPEENIGWNIRPGGDCSVGFTMPEGTATKIAKQKVCYSKLDALNILIDYYEKGYTQAKVARKYKLDDKVIWKIISGKQKAYPSIEDVRQVVKDSRPFKSFQPGSISEDLYDEILTCRESGMTWEDLSNKFGIPPGTIKNYCYGESRYLKEFKTYGVVDYINRPKPYVYGGESKSLKELSEEFGMNMQTVASRLKSGWSIEKALETPVRKMKNASNI